VNLKSGETFETRVKRARGKEKHREGVSSGVYLGIVLAFAFIVLGGYIYQSRMERVMRQRPDLFVSRVEEMQQVEDLIATEQYGEARARLEELAEALERKADSIKPPDPYAPEKKRQPWMPRKKAKEWDQRGGKRLLRNLKAKAEHRLEKLDETGSSG
jgi:hypothetical protein